MAASSRVVPVCLPEFHLEKETNVYVPRAKRSSACYRDGAEQHVIRTLRHAADISTGSTELSRAIRDFASRYHLSPERVNLLRPLQSLLRGRIAEIGAGCGAITRFLGETGSEVVAVEAAYERALACRLRCRDLKNVSVVAGELHDLGQTGAFDVVVVVGVLEYSQLFMGGQWSGQRGPKAFLQACKRLLKDGGHLILAIENQLGLKYFAGAPEDHLDQPYSGIEGRYTEASPVTFGRSELRRLIAAAGWTRQQYLYPFPDYKFPNVIIGEEMLEEHPELAASVLRFTPATDPAQPYYASFPEELVWPNAIRNGLAQGLANSFLVVASDGDGEFVRCPLHVYSTRRRRAFSKLTQLDPSTSAVVRRRSLYPADFAAAQVEAAAIRQQLEDELIIQGRTLSEELCGVLNNPGWTASQVADRAREWITYLRNLCAGGFDAADPLLTGDLLDCIPANLIRDGSGSLQRFDQEWVAQEPIPLSRIVARGLFDVFMRLRSVAVRGDSLSDSIFELVVHCLDLLALTPARCKVEAAVADEVRFQEYVCGEPRSEDLYTCSRFPCVRRSELIRHFGGLSPSDTESRTSLALALAEARQNVHRLQRELALVRSSRSYRLSRRVGRLLGR